MNRNFAITREATTFASQRIRQHARRGLPGGRRPAVSATSAVIAPRRVDHIEVRSCRNVGLISRVCAGFPTTVLCLPKITCPYLQQASAHAFLRDIPTVEVIDAVPQAIGLEARSGSTPGAESRIQSLNHRHGWTVQTFCFEI